MRLRHKPSGKLCDSHKFTANSMNEITVYFEDDCDSLFVRDFEVELGIGENVYWKDLEQAFKDHDVITDNLNTRFFEPKTEEDKKRGYTIE